MWNKLTIASANFHIFNCYKLLVSTPVRRTLKFGMWEMRNPHNYKCKTTSKKMIYWTLIAVTVSLQPANPVLADGVASEWWSCWLYPSTSVILFSVVWIYYTYHCYLFFQFDWYKTFNCCWAVLVLFLTFAIQSVHNVSHPFLNIWASKYK